MKALVLSPDSGSLELAEMPLPSLVHDDDVLVDVIQTGICGTDRSVLVGKFSAAPGTIMGHEAVGVIAAVGPQSGDLQPGSRVVINPTLFCGHCTYCRKGRFNHCRNKHGNEVGIDRHGTYAERVVLPARFVTRLPDDVSDDRATLFEPLCCAMSNIAASGLEVGGEVIVLGGGPVGALVALSAALAGGRSSIVEVDSARRALLATVFAHPLMPAVEVKSPAELDDDRRVDVVVDAVGTLLEDAVKLLRPDGCVVIMGYNESSAAQIRPIDILFNGVRIVGAGDYNFPFFQKAVDLGSALPLERLITHRFPLEHHSDAFDLLSPKGQTYGALKVVLTSR